MATYDEDDERLQGVIFKVAGPLVVASRMSGSFMHELVRVGHKRIVVRVGGGVWCGETPRRALL